MPLDIDRIQGICFDIDGTLRDTDDHYVERLLQILSPFLILSTQESKRNIARRLVMRLEGPINAFLHFADRMGFDSILHRSLDWFSSHSPQSDKKTFHLIPGVNEILDLLAPHFPLAVVTTRRASSTMDFLEGTQLTERFQAIATALTTERGKPRPDPVLWAAAQLGLPPENCLMVGDTVMDIRAGKSAGAQTLGVLSGFGEEKELRDSGADQIIESVAEIKNLFSNIS